MNAGELVWAGPSEKMLTHFRDVGFECPLDVNPLQYLGKLIIIVYEYVPQGLEWMYLRTVFTALLLIYCSTSHFLRDPSGLHCLQ